MATAAIIGLTGGIGSGKSTLCAIMQKWGVPCLDADKVVHDILGQASHPAVLKLNTAFPSIQLREGRINRGALRNYLIDHPAANGTLIAMFKPHVLRQMTIWAEQQTTPYVIWESALIAEAAVPVDRILVVSANRALRDKRVRSRNPDWTESQIESIFSLQAEQDTSAFAADDIVHNEGSVQELQQQAQCLHASYLKLWGRQ